MTRLPKTENPSARTRAVQPPRRRRRPGPPPCSPAAAVRGAPPPEDLGAAGNAGRGTDDPRGLGRQSHRRSGRSVQTRPVSSPTCSRVKGEHTRG